MRAVLLARWTILAVLLQVLLPSGAMFLAYAAADLQYRLTTAVLSDTVGEPASLSGASEARDPRAAAAIPPAAPEDAQRDAMIALYHNTGGPNWTHHDGWLTEPDMCDWYGVGSCWTDHVQQRIFSLDLSNNNLVGPLPAQLGDLVDLDTLWLSGNKLSGQIPESIGNLTKLEQLHLDRNKLTGQIPSSLKDLALLEELRLGNNKLTGPIPPALGALSALRTLGLDQNELSGSIPPGLGSLANLSSLGLSHNRLSGGIPPTLTGLTQLYDLTLGGNPLGGTIPPDLGNLKKLTWLDLSGCALEGAIPENIGELTHLRFLGLSRNDLEGTVPAVLGSLNSLTNLYVSDNSELTGPLPQSLIGLDGMFQLTYDDTDLCMPNNDPFRDWLQTVKSRGGVSTNWKICSIEPHLSFSTPNALIGDVVLMHARLVDDELGRIKGSAQVSATLTGVEDPLAMSDGGAEDGDLLATDGHYSRWSAVGMEGGASVEAVLYYKGWPVISSTLALMTDPELIVLTDLRRLDEEFTKSGAEPGEDLDGNDSADVYDLLDRQRLYAEKYHGIVYDLGHTITKAHSFDDDYDQLDAHPDNSERRMGNLIQALMARLYAETGTSIRYLVIAGSRPVAPGFIVDPVGNDSKTDFRRSDLPYAMRAFSGAGSGVQPTPDLPWGRISAGRPGGLAEMYDAYEQPLVIDPAINAFTFYRENDGAFQVWEQDWQSWVTARFVQGELSDAPLFRLGSYYNYEGSVVMWWDSDVLEGLKGATWTVLNSHGMATDQNTQALTQLGRGAGLPSPRLEGTDLASIPRQPGHLFINAGCHAGLQPSAGGKVYMSQGVLDRHITYVGNTNVGMEYDDPLWVAFADHLALVSTPTIGAAWVAAYGPYWARWSSADTSAVSQAYVKAFYGLPTQPVRHGAAAEATVSAAPEWAARTAAPAASQRELTLSVDVPYFVFEQSGTGAIVRPASGGAVLSEEGQPVMPLVAARVLLPAVTTAVTVTELTAQRQVENAGRVDLQITEMLIRCSGIRVVLSVPAVETASTGAYPIASFRANAVSGSDGWVLYLSAIPASYAADHQLTLFHHMTFRISYAAASPSESVSLGAVTVNDGLALRTGQPAVPLKVAVTSGRAMSLTLAYQVTDPAGFTLTDRQALVTLPAGASQVAMTMDTRGWQPGPKQLNVTIAGAEGIYDARTVALTPQGLRLELQADSRLLPGLPWTLALTARDETGAPITGLAARITLSLDGAPAGLTFTQTAPGAYRGVVPSSALAPGVHRAVVTVTDPRGMSAVAATEVAVEVYGRDYLPLTRQ